MSVSVRNLPATEELTRVMPKLAVNVFDVSVGIRNFADPMGPELMEPTLSVMELTNSLGTVEVLIGLDFLLACRFLLDGPARQFSLEF